MFRNIYFNIQDIKNKKRSAREVFTDIYLKRKWGCEKDGYYSGPGSHIGSIIRPYVDLIINYLVSTGSRMVVVDLGCGDFYVGRYFLPYCSKYIGIDVVPDLINQNKLHNQATNVEFICLDITEDNLPEGDVCLIRQVLQHLSNEEIIKILHKLKKYKVVFITEHYPLDNQQIIPNKNIVHGERIRVLLNSGIYLDRPPFNIDTSRIKLVLEVPGTEIAKGCAEGVIRTLTINFNE